MKYGVRTALPLAICVLVFAFLFRFIFGNHTFEQCGEESIIISIVSFVTYIVAYYKSDCTWRHRYPRQLYSSIAGVATLIICVIFRHGAVFDSAIFILIYSVAMAFVYRFGYQDRMFGPRLFKHY